MTEQLVETWNIHDRVSEEALGSALAPKHRTVFQLFAHIHNVRLMWLKAAVPALMEGLAKLEGDSGEIATLRYALEDSGRAIEALLQKSIAEGGKVKGFKPHATAFVGYLISHESHHRGQIVWTLKNTGHKLDQKTAYGMWEWGVR